MSSQLHFAREGLFDLAIKPEFLNFLEVRLENNISPQENIPLDYGKRSLTGLSKKLLSRLSLKYGIGPKRTIQSCDVLKTTQVNTIDFERFCALAIQFTKLCGEFCSLN